MDPTFFHSPAPAVARDLIGALFLVDGVGGRIVETEAYDADDPASHNFNGPTARNAAMFEAPGHAYDYRIYGLHWCFNIVCVDLMHRRRDLAPLRQLCAGPGRLCQALAIDGRLNRAPVTQAPFTLLAAPRPATIAHGFRIGVRAGAETPWRFCEAGSPFLSRPMREASA